jgi:lysyl-tRNA synthetase class 2
MDNATVNTTNTTNITNTENIKDNTNMSDSNEISYGSERKNYVLQQKEASENPYPHHFNQTMQLKQYVEQYSPLENESVEQHIENISGRVESTRDYKKLFFCTIWQGDSKLQLMMNMSSFETQGNSNKEKERYFRQKVSNIKRGDIIGAIGNPCRSKTGELSLLTKSFKILAPCLKMLPTSHFGLTNDEERYRHRYIDLIVNKDSREIFYVRSKVIKFLRKYLDDREFMEVETPILAQQAGGAAAKPFKTYHNSNKTEMTMRIATELPLKQLVVGGFDRVYEIGKQFRNESIDRTHSPEFTSVEFYMAYADYNDLMNMAEDFFPKLAMHIHGSYKVKCKSFESDNEIMEVDFTPPFARFDFVGELEKETSTIFPKDLSSEDARVFLDELCNKYNIECSSPRTTTRLLDKLAGHFIEPKCINPSFVINHPAIMSPLAKWHRDNANFSERFELFMLGHEFANAYTELNDPFVQREAFENQLKDKNSGDEEAQDVDNIFIDALECGLPPTGGFGIGIDRLVMLMAGTNRIQDVILFPAMK